MFYFKKMDLKMLFAKCQPFCAGLDVLRSWTGLDSVSIPDFNSVNSLWPSDPILRWRSWSTLVQIMACCLTAPSHYLNQCRLIISETSDIHLRTISQEIPQWSVTKIINFFNMPFKSLRGHWITYYQGNCGYCHYCPGDSATNAILG